MKKTVFVCKITICAHIADTIFELQKVLFLNNVRYLVDRDKDPRRAATQSPSAPRCLLDSACLRIPGVLRRIASHE